MLRRLLVRVVSIVVICLKHSTLDRGFIEQNRVFHVVAGIAHNRDNRIDAIGLLFPCEIFQISRFQKRNLPVSEYNARFVHTIAVIGVINGYCLTTLAARELVTCNGIVLGEDGVIAHISENERFVDFQMREFAGGALPVQLMHIGRNQCVLCFTGVHEIHDGFFVARQFRVFAV